MAQDPITQTTLQLKSFVKKIRKMHDAWQKQHDYDEGMRGGYGNPLLAVDLMEKIEEMVK